MNNNKLKKEINKSTTHCSAARKTDIRDVGKALLDWDRELMLSPLFSFLFFFFSTQKKEKKREGKEN